MTRVGERVRATARWVATELAGLRPRTILITGWLIFLLYAYPGYMSSDSIDQLLDSRVGTFNDWHSPTMTEIWRLLGFAIAGPFGMLALQSLLLLCGGYALLARTLAARRAALLASGLLLFPPVMTTMAVIWQDSQMAGFLVAGLTAVTSRRRGWQLGGLGLLVLASAMRAAAVFAVLPILVIGWASCTDGPALAGWRRYASALAVWAAVWLGALGLNAALRSATTGHTRIELATLDLMGTLRYAGPIDDADAHSILAGISLRGSDLQARARDFDAHPAGLTSGPDRMFDPPTDDESRDAIVAAHHRIAIAYPAAYLTQRWHMMYRVLGPRNTSAGNPVYVGFSGSAWQSDAAVHTARHSAVQRGLIASVQAVGRTPLFWPFVYAIAALLLLPLAVRRRQALATTLLASGLGYELTLFATAIGPQYALSHWMITATSFAGIVLAVDAARTRRARVAGTA